MIMATFTDIANQNNTHQSFLYDDDVYRFTSNNGQDWIYDRGGNNSVYLNGTVDMSKLKFVLTNSLIGQTNSLKITGYNANNAITINNFFALSSQHFKLYVNNVLYQSKITLSFKDFKSVNLDFSKQYNLLYSKQALNFVDLPNATALDPYASNFLRGTDYDDDILDSLGDDHLFGGNGNDIIRSRSGRDEIDGEDGQDVLHSIAGHTRMTGGLGVDTFKIGAGSGFRTIKDFEKNETLILENKSPTDVRFSLSYDEDDGNQLNITNTNVYSIFLSPEFWGVSSNTNHDGSIDSFDIDTIVFGNQVKSLSNWGSPIDVYINNFPNTDPAPNQPVFRVNLPGNASGRWLPTFNTNIKLESIVDQSNTFIGTDGDDQFRGRFGNDTYYGGRGNDIMTDNYGNNTFIFQRGHGQDIIDGWNNEGVQTIKFLDSLWNQVTMNQINSTDLIIKYVDSTDSILIKNYYKPNAAGHIFEVYRNFKFEYANQIPVLITNTGNDNLFGKAQSTNLNGGLGDDVIIAGIGDLTAYGGEGNDYLRGSNMADKLYGDNGIDNLLGLAGNDVLYGGAGADQLSGNLGNDTLFGQDGNDLLMGDEGNDVYNGGAGSDSFFDASGNDSYIFYQNSGKDFLLDYDASTFDTLRFIDTTRQNASFSRRDDDLVISYAGTGNQVWVTGYFNDTNDTYKKHFQFTNSTLTVANMQSGSMRFDLNGTNFNDTLKGSRVSDVINGLNGNDVLFGYDGADVLQGHAGNDTLYGGNGNDGLNGGAGNDILYGQNGNDSLYGGMGNDIDTYMFYIGSGSDLVIDTDDTSAVDTLKFVNINSATAKFTRVGNDLSISSYGGANDKVVVKQFYDTSVHAKNKKFQFSNTTLNATQVSNLVQQANGLRAAMATTGATSASVMTELQPSNRQVIELTATANH